MKRKQAAAALVMAIALMSAVCSVAYGVPIANRFVAGAPVQTAAGARAIEKIQKGDRVWARDPGTGKTELKAVLQTFVHKAPAVVTLGFSQSAAGPVVEHITCTPQHPFYVAGRGFVQAGELGIGTQIVTRAGPALFLKTVSRRNEPAGVPVYNFEVEGDHTYFVGSAGEGLWVHNDCPGQVFYRGGPSLSPRPSELKMDGNLVLPRRGPSLNVDPAKVERFGGAYRVDQVADELQVVQRGRDPGHFEIIPRETMPYGEYVGHLESVVLTPNG
jgi:hypothetical protein